LKCPLRTSLDNFIQDDELLGASLSSANSMGPTRHQVKPNL
jgi:hypothetical protein